MATILENEAAWSTTAATNANVDTGINWVENQDAASVNNSARGMMAARRKAALDQGGALTAGGTANALTVTTNQVLSAAHLMAGLRLSVRATATNTSATVTFAPDGLTASNIMRVDGSALGVGSIQAGTILDLVYYPGASNWRALNIPALGGFGGYAAFAGHKNGVDQSILTTAATMVTWGSAYFNTGGTFLSNTWVPPAGLVQMAAAINLTNFDQGGFSIAIYKNSVARRQNIVLGPANDALVSLIDTANGTDYYQVFSATASDANYTVSGNSLVTWFEGSVL